MEDQYGMLPDLRQYIDARPNFFPTPAPPTAADLLSGHCGLTQTHPYDMLVFPPEESAAAGTSSAVSNIPAGASSRGGGYGAFESGVGFGGGDGAAGRWPRQETLTLLEIRSRLDSKFKEANQKGPLWDEISRILSEEHGYQRSGKKCREKFENLYKYYKKTKEGKAGRQDGKHYRFFRQLEALYGDNNNNISSGSASEAQYQPHPIGGSASIPYNFPKFSDNTSLSLSNYSEPDTTSSDDTDGNNNGAADPNGKGKMGWQAKIKDFIDLQMKNLMDKQEAWMEKMMTTIECKEQERLLREEEWRKQDAARIEQERRFWAGERAWIEARDAALMETLHKVTGMEFMAAADIRTENGNEAARCEMWMENEQRQKGLVTENAVWDDMGSKMGAGSYLIKCGKKRRENSKSCAFYGDEGVYCVNSNQQGIEPVMRLNDQSNTSPNVNNGGNDNHNDTCNGVNAMSESCFRYFIGDGYGRIMD